MMLTTATGAGEPMDAPIASAARRVRADFLEMPGLQLTPAQAARLWALDMDVCEGVLAAMVDAGFLVRTSKALFRRASSL